MSTQTIRDLPPEAAALALALFFEVWDAQTRDIDPDTRAEMELGAAKELGVRGEAPGLVRGLLERAALHATSPDLQDEIDQELAKLQ